MNKQIKLVKNDDWVIVIRANKDLQQEMTKNGISMTDVANDMNHIVADKFQAKAPQFSDRWPQQYYDIISRATNKNWDIISARSDYNTLTKMVTQVKRNFGDMIDINLVKLDKETIAIFDEMANRKKQYGGK